MPEIQTSYPRATWFLTILILAVAFRVSAAAQAFIVNDGKPEAEIVIATKSARMTKLAAKDLQAYLKKITGAELAVVDEPTGKVPVKIYVGKSSHTDELGLNVDDLKHGAYKMVSGSDWLALLGNDKDFVPQKPYGLNHGDKRQAAKDWEAAHPGKHYGFPYYRMGINGYFPEFDVWSKDDHGTYNAVCAFLRNLGVRWYFPGEIGEVVPKEKSVPLPKIDETVNPDFPMRRFGYWNIDRYPEVFLWNLRLGVNPGHEMMGNTQNCHGSKWVYMEKEVKESHPEWYALWNGKRATDHSYSGAPCLSNPELFDRHVRFARMIFDERGEPILSLDACDGYGRGLCQCPLCAGKGTPERGREGAMSDYVWGYVNRLAAELKKTNPDRMVSGLSYSSYRLPPEKIETLSDNVALVLCQGRSGFYDRELRDATAAKWKAWLEKMPSKELYIYDYYLHNRPRAYAGIPVFFPHAAAEDLRSLKGKSRGDMIEVYLHPPGKEFPWRALATMHLNIYATARLWWDADLDMDQLLDEYCESFYGPAASKMREFIDHSEANWPFMTKKVEPITKALDLLDEAQKVAGDTVYGERVKMVADYCATLRQLRDRLSRARENVPDARALKRSMKGEEIDGDLSDEKHWPPRIRVYSLSDNMTGRSTNNKKSAYRTTFQVFWGCDDALYFGIRCWDSDMANLTVTTTENDDPAIFDGDYVELLIETQTHSYYRIAVNPAGALYDADMGEDGEGAAWTSGVKAAVKRGEDCWTAEIRVPWSGDLAREIDPLTGIDGRKPSRVYPWCVNVCQQRVRGDAIERAAWSPTKGERFDDVMKFGTVYIK